MKKIIATTALGFMLTSAAYAGNTSTAVKFYTPDKANDIYASDFIGMRVYSSANEFDTMGATTEFTENDARNWDDIGEINNVILSRDGNVKAVVLGVGGFLGINEKDVAVDMNSIKFVNEKDDEDDFFLVIKANKQSLIDAQEFDNQWRETNSVQQNAIKLQDEDANSETDNTTTASTETDEMETDRAHLRRPMVEMDGWSDAELQDLTTEALTGARLYSTNNEDIGEVDQLIVNSSGQIERAVLDIGGFLGLGEHRIAVPLEEIQIKRTDDGNEFRVYIDATQEALEAQPAYSG